MSLGQEFIVDAEPGCPYLDITKAHYSAICWEIT